jgi:hypothetical protein
MEVNPMGWLDEIAKRGVQSWSLEQDRERKKETEKREFEHEAKRLRRPVISLLKSVGKAYWGSVGRRYSISDGYAGYLSVDSNYNCFAVILTRAEDGHFFFRVISRGEALETKDTSEEGLKVALSKATEFGPFHRS